jgi:hypothetical protein
MFTHGGGLQPVGLDRRAVSGKNMWISFDGQRTGVAPVTMTATKATRAENLEKSGNGTRQSIRQVRSGFVIHQVYLIGRADNTSAILVHVADLGG